MTRRQVRSASTDRAGYPGRIGSARRGRARAAATGARGEIMKPRCSGQGLWTGSSGGGRPARTILRTTALQMTGLYRRARRNADPGGLVRPQPPRVRRAACVVREFHHPPLARYCAVSRNFPGSDTLLQAGLDWYMTDNNTTANQINTLLVVNGSGTAEPADRGGDERRRMKIPIRRLPMWLRPKELPGSLSVNLRRLRIQAHRSRASR